ncbi:hypothetical protein JCM8097_002268 [Rhodosporidiobolus ruineniae]
MSSYDDWLLQQDWTASVTLSGLSTLSPAGLAVAALRPDLDSFVRQRATVVFLERRAAYSSANGKQPEEPLFALRLHLPIPSSVDSLSPTRLLLLQFNPNLPSPDVANAAASRFLGLARSAATSSGAPLSSKADSVEVFSWSCEWVGRKRDEGAGFRLKLVEDELMLVREMDGEPELLVKASEIEEIKYLAGEDDGEEDLKIQCAFVIRASTVETSPTSSIPNATLCFDLGMRGLEDEAFSALRKRVNRWKKMFRVKVSLEVTSDTPITAACHSPTPSASPVVVQSRDDCWHYVSSKPTTVEWQPGFFVRQFAFAESIDPYSSFAFPTFSDEEIVLLSFDPDPLNLPTPPRPLEIAGGQQYFGSYSVQERLALERIYRSAHGGSFYLTLHQTRYLLAHPAYASLQRYATLVSKIIHARDALRAAYRQLLETRLCPRQDWDDNVDPVDTLIPLVEGLRDDVDHFCATYFSDTKCRLTGRNRFTSTLIGGGPFHRYEAALAKIVEYEDGVWERYQQRERA